MANVKQLSDRIQQAKKAIDANDKVGEVLEFMAEQQRQIDQLEEQVRRFEEFRRGMDTRLAEIRNLPGRVAPG